MLTQALQFPISTQLSVRSLALNTSWFDRLPTVIMLRLEGPSADGDVLLPLV